MVWLSAIGHWPLAAFNLILVQKLAVSNWLLAAFHRDW